MSYRTLKRVLGETSLERKCRFLFGGCLLALITSSFWWYGRKTERLVLKQNSIKAQQLVDTVITAQHWNILETNEEFRDKYLKVMTDRLINNRSYQVSFLKTYPTLDGKSQPIDNVEQGLLDYFKTQRPASVVAAPAGLADAPPPADEPTPFYERIVDNIYLYYQPVYASDHTCVDCHTHFPGGRITDLVNDVPLPTTPRVEEGDLIAVAKVGIPYGPTTRDLNENRAILLATAIVTVALAMLASWLIVRYVIVKPLKHLRDVSDAVSHGQVDQRAEIHTGDEFEALGVAFNRMLRHLIEAHAELRHVNADLDSKVDELAQMNMRLYEMNRLKGDFLATMSHELRTPLNSIIGFSDVLGSISSLDDKQKRYVQNIQKSGKMLLDMINGVLDLAKMESGKMEVRPSHFHIAHVISGLCDMCRPLTEKKNIDLEIVIQPGLPVLFQDQGKVQQILNNLLSNAIKFTPEGGRICIVARHHSNDYLVLEVTDTGVGIAETDQQNIFEKFRQGDVVLPSGDAMTREYSGTGLGLSIVKELCRLLGGEILLVSELGKGSTFTVSLPWSLPDKPRPDGVLAEQLQELTRPRRGDFALPLVGHP